MRLQRPGALSVIFASGIEALAASAFLEPSNITPQAEIQQTEITSPKKYKVDKNAIGYIATSVCATLLMAGSIKRDKKQYLINISVPRESYANSNL